MLQERPPRVSGRAAPSVSRRAGRHRARTRDRWVRSSALSVPSELGASRGAEAFWPLLESSGVGAQPDAGLRVLWRALQLLVALAVAGLLGCASYSEQTQGARSALDAGDSQKALSLFNERLGVDTIEDVPPKVDGEKTLLLLDRAMVLQSVSKNELSSRDLQIADKQIEILDFSKTSADTLGKYMFSDDTGPYRAPFYEKLLINTVNMVNYLEAGDLNGARVEARRLTVMQNYIEDHEREGLSLTGPGSYLAGFIFEKSGQPGEALRYYDEALQARDFHSLRPAVSRLAARDAYRTPRLEKLIDESAATPEENGDLLVLVNHGRVPSKVAKRVPIGLALTYASGAISPESRRRAQELAAQGVVTWVNFPAMGELRAVPPARLTVDGVPEPLELALAVDKEAVKAWASALGSIVSSAITRMVTRVVAGQAAKKVGGGGLLGAVLSLGTQATLTANDVPDTRSWGTLPARISIARLSLPPGKHVVEVVAGRDRERVPIELEAGGWAFVNVTSLR